MRLTVPMFAGAALQTHQKRSIHSTSNSTTAQFRYTPDTISFGASSQQGDSLNFADNKPKKVSLWVLDGKVVDPLTLSDKEKERADLQEYYKDGTLVSKERLFKIPKWDMYTWRPEK